LQRVGSEAVRRHATLELHVDGLLGYFRACGVAICHLPLRDPAHLLAEESGSWKEVELRPVQAAALGVYR
jgi:hypothetical protein